MSGGRPVIRIAVIGVGSAGLAALKQAVDAFSREEVSPRTRLELVGFETRDDVGGLWGIRLRGRNYVADVKPFAQSTRTGKDGEVTTYRYPVEGENPTPFYENLRATLPGDLSAFRDLPFLDDAPFIPWGRQVHEYLQSYADKFDLRQYTRFKTRVERLYHTDSSSGSGSRRWTLESNGPSGAQVEEFDFVSVTNGHYSDCYIPTIRGLELFPGQVMHSREYRRAEDHVGKTILVIGAGNSGADIVRHLSSLNLDLYTPEGKVVDEYATVPVSQGFTTVYQSVTGANRGGYNSGNEPWAPYIRTVTTIDHVEGPTTSHPKGTIHLRGDDGTVLADVDLIIFATGYNNSLPFSKATDEPWKSVNVLDEVIRPDEREGGDRWEIGGVKGLHMTGLDELLLFLRDDRTIAFPGLPYQIVPFPFSEVQARLSSLLWAGLLPSFPDHPTLPRNRATATVTATAIANAYLTPPQKPPADDTKTLLSPTTRISESTRKELIFAVPYEFTYTQYLFDLMEEAHGEDVPIYWREVEEWRRQRRADTGLRKRMLGF